MATDAGGEGKMRINKPDVVVPPEPLLPCPFCGSQTVLTRLGGVGSTYGWVGCSGCVTVQKYEPTFEAACRRWNTRPVGTSTIRVEKEGK